MATTDYNSRQPVRTEADGDVVVFLADPTTPSNRIAIDSSGRIVIKLDDGSGNLITSQVNGTQRALDIGINVAGVQIDPRLIRALTSSDIVTAYQGTPNTIANAWPVKITDGTNTVSVTSTGSVPVTGGAAVGAAPNGSPVSVSGVDGGGLKRIFLTDANGKIQTLLNDTSGNGITSQVNGTQRALDVGINVAGVQVDPRAIRLLTATDVVTANIKDATGTAFSSTNPLPVIVSSSLPGTEVNNYFVSATNVASLGSDNHDYTITASKVFKAKKFTMSASGRIRADVQVSTDGTTFTTIMTVWTSASTPTVQIDMGQMTLSDSGTGSKIRIIRTNEDKQPFGIFSTISGVEV